MKKTKQMKFWMILLTLSIWGTSSLMSATNFGMKAGLTMSKFTGDTTLEEVDSMGGTLGIYGKQDLTNWLSIIGELNLIQKGSLQHQTIEESTYTFTNTLNYLEIPLLLKVNITNTLGIYAGGYASKLLDAKVSINGGDPFDTTDFLNKDDYGTIIGINYTIDPSFSFDLRLTQGQESIISTGEMLNQSFSFAANKSF